MQAPEGTPWKPVSGEIYFLSLSLNSSSFSAALNSDFSLEFALFLGEDLCS
jgi:hypothetical protein